MQRIQTRLRLGYGLVFGGALALGGALLVDAISGRILGFPWSLVWFVLSMIPAAGIALVFLTAIEERHPTQLEEAE